MPLEACVLHHHDWSESSLILDLFTREQGRLVVAAKGAKRPTSQLRPVLLPFQRLQVTLGRAPAEGAEVQTLRGAEWAGGLPLVSGAGLFPGFYLNELLMKLLARHDPHPALFDAYLATLPLLGAADEAATQAALRAFELCLLRETGVLPDLGRVTSTQQPLAPGRRYALSPEHGIGPAGDGAAGIEAEVLGVLQAALDHGNLPALRQACAVVLPELRSDLRACLHYHLGSSSLRTRQVMLDVQKLQGRVADATPPPASRHPPERPDR